jgi:hypothetical protein
VVEHKRLNLRDAGILLGIMLDKVELLTVEDAHGRDLAVGSCVVISLRSLFRPIRSWA